MTEIIYLSDSSLEDGAAANGRTPLPGLACKQERACTSEQELEVCFTPFACQGPCYLTSSPAMNMLHYLLQCPQMSSICTCTYITLNSLIAVEPIDGGTLALCTPFACTNLCQKSIDCLELTTTTARFATQHSERSLPTEPDSDEGKSTADAALPPSPSGLDGALGVATLSRSLGGREQHVQSPLPAAKSQPRRRANHGRRPSLASSDGEHLHMSTHS